MISSVDNLTRMPVDRSDSRVDRRARFRRAAYGALAIGLAVASGALIDHKYGFDEAVLHGQTPAQAKAAERDFNREHAPRKIGCRIIAAPNSTLWGIAEALRPDGDVRALVDTFTDQLPASGVLHPGDVLIASGIDCPSPQTSQDMAAGATFLRSSQQS